MTTWTGTRALRTALVLMVTIAGTALVPCRAEAATYTWRNVANGNWNDPNNWADGPAGGFPNAVGDIASFPGPYTNAIVIVVPNSVTVGEIICTTSVDLTIRGGAGAALILDNGPLNNVQLQSNFNAIVTLDLPLRLHGALTAHVGPGGDVSFSASVSEVGDVRGVTKVGPGTLRFAAGNTFTGETAVRDGGLALQSQAGPSVSGDISIGDDNGAAQSARAIMATPTRSRIRGASR